MLVLVIAIAAVGAAAYYFSSTMSAATGGSNPILTIEGTSSNINLATGEGTIYITAKNTGSGQLLLYNLTIDGKVPFVVTANATASKVDLYWNGTHLEGTWRASSGAAGVVGNEILVPGGESVTMTFTFNGTTGHKFTDIIDVGATYSGIALPTTGRPIAFHFSVPS